jgi:hypothetical protein
VLDSALAVLGANCRCLSTLYLSTCWKITDVGAFALFEGAPPLRVLDLSRSQGGGEKQTAYVLF